jgi:ATP synthase protein I
MQPRDDERPWTLAYGPYLTLGLQLAISVVALFFAGRWLDDRWGTAPWLMLAGLLLGAAGGFVNFFRTVIRLGKQEDKAQREKKDGTHET